MRRLPCGHILGSGALGLRGRLLGVRSWLLPTRVRLKPHSLEPLLLSPPVHACCVLAGVGRRHASLARPVCFLATVARSIHHPAQPAKTRATTSTARPVRRNALNATTRRYQSRGAAHASTSSLPARLRLAPALCFAAVSATTANTTKRPTRRQAPRKWNVSGLIRLTSSREPGASRRSKNWKQRTCGCLVDGGAPRRFPKVTRAKLSRLRAWRRRGHKTNDRQPFPAAVPGPQGSNHQPVKPQLKSFSRC